MPEKQQRCTTEVCNFDGDVETVCDNFSFLLVCLKTCSISVSFEEKPGGEGGQTSFLTLQLIVVTWRDMHDQAESCIWSQSTLLMVCSVIPDSVNGETYLYLYVVWWWWYIVCFILDLLLQTYPPYFWHVNWTWNIIVGDLSVCRLAGLTSISFNMWLFVQNWCF